MATAGRTAASAFFQGLIYIYVQSGKGRRQSAEKPGNDRKQQCESYDGPVQADLADAWQALRQEVLTDVQRESGEQQSKQPTAHAENKAFKNGLADECGCWRSQRLTNSDLSLPLNGAYQLQAREVGTGDQQDYRYREKEYS